MPSSAPIFMFGLDRSGTTLLSMMVGAHPRIAVPLSTTGIWYRLAGNISANLDTKEHISKSVDTVLQQDRIRLWDQTLDRENIREAVTAGSYGSFIAAFQAEYARQCKKPIWASMDIATLDHMHQVNEWLPEARFVHLVRDGRDVALSHQGYAYGFGNIGEVADRWRERVTRNLRVGAMLPAERYHILRYEDLILHPETTLASLCKFIGVEYSADMLNYRDAVQRKVPKDKMSLWPALQDPPQKSKAARWKHQMSHAQRIVFEQRAAALLDELGYETFDPIPRSVSALLLDMWYCLTHGHRLKRLKAKLRK